RQVGAHQAVMPGSIDRELLAMSIGQAVLVRALQHELCCLIKSSGRRDAMQAGQVAKVFVGSSTGRLVLQRRPLTNAKEWLLTKSIERSARDKEANQAAHKLMRIALTLRLANLQHKTHTYAQIDGSVRRGNKSSYYVDAIFIPGSPISSCDSPSRQTRCHSSRLSSRQMRS